MQYTHLYSQTHVHIKHIRMPVMIHNIISLSVLIHLQLQAHISVCSQLVYERNRSAVQDSHDRCVCHGRD